MATDLSPAEWRLLDAWQHGFPLTARPFAQLGDQVGLSEQEVLTRFQRWQTDGVVSRIGPVLNQACFASALVGMQVPLERLQAVAAYISSLPQVNHNYLREHPINLWFVAACRSQGALADLMAQIRNAVHCHPLRLPMEAAYHIDLGFSLSGQPDRLAAKGPFPTPALPPDGSAAFALLCAVQEGIALCAAPYRDVGVRVGLTETEVLHLLQRWLRQGLLRRFGVVLQHRRLGYRANAMCVWDVDDTAVDAIGKALGAQAGVTLCYRRTRRLPQWPYNLFCMIHGKARSAVLAQRDAIAARLGLDAWPHDILFSTHCFKQRGMRISARTGTDG